MGRIFFTSLVFTLIAFLQTSFFAHFSVFSIVPNLVLLAFFLFLLSGRSNSATWFFPAVVSGLVLDMYSNAFIGFWPVLLLAFGFFGTFVACLSMALMRFCNDVELGVIIFL